MLIKLPCVLPYAALEITFKEHCKRYLGISGAECTSPTYHPFYRPYLQPWKMARGRSLPDVECSTTASGSSMRRVLAQI